MSTRFYTMSPTFLLRLVHTNDNLCAKCGKPFKAGDQVVSKQKANNTKRFHEDCYNSLFIEA